MRTEAHESKFPLAPVAIVYALNGLMFSAWFLYVATIVRHLALSPTEVGIALLGLPAGLVSGTTLSPRLITRFGTGRVAITGLLIYCATLPLPAMAGNAFWLMFALSIPGFGNGMLDPAMSLLCNRCEQERRRALQGYMFGLFGLTQIGQAVVAPWAIGRGVSALVYLGVTGAVGVVVTGLTAPVLARARSTKVGAPQGESETEHASRWWRWTLSAAALFLAAAATEGIWADWHGQYLSTSGINAPLALAAVGYLAYQITTVVSRFAHPRFVDRFGIPAVLSASIFVAAVGAVVIVTAHSTQAGFVGAALLGLGAGPVGPLAMSAPGQDSRAVALITGIGYTGLVAAPALMGFLAGAFTLRTALWSLVGLAVMMAVGAALLRPRLARPKQPRSGPSLVDPLTE
jgi:MFS family permease